jgi:DNA-3-methyladenine glycosylase II
VKLIANNNPNPSTPEKASTPRRRRKVDPHATNAPLQTPGGSRLTSYPSSVFESGSQTPSASQASDNELTTENLLERACAHLVAVDPRLKTVIEQNHCKMFSPEGLAEEVDPFAALASGIIGQQVRDRQYSKRRANESL